MTNTEVSTRLEMRWVPVTDASGRTHMEAVCFLGGQPTTPAHAACRTPHTARRPPPPAGRLRCFPGAFPGADRVPTTDVYLGDPGHPLPWNG